MAMEYWSAQLRQLQSVYGKLTDKVQYTKRDPLTAEQAQALAEKLGTELPESLYRVLTEFAGGLEFEADYAAEVDDLPLTVELNSVMQSAGLAFSPQLILQAEQVRRELEQEVFVYDTEYDRMWHNKLAFMQAPGEDLIAFDLASGEDPAIVYLSCNEGKGHGLRLGENLVDFLDHFITLGMPGPKDVQWLPFYDEDAEKLDLQGENAYLFWQGIGLDWREEYLPAPYGEDLPE